MQDAAFACWGAKLGPSHAFCSFLRLSNANPAVSSRQGLQDQALLEKRFSMGCGEKNKLKKTPKIHLACSELNPPLF